MKILVIGGRGFYGQKVVASLQRFAELTVETASRNGPVAIDLNHPPTFSALHPFDAIVNVADSVRADPCAAAAWCVRNGKTWFDVSADVQTAERLLAIDDQGPGAVLVGAGLFPGISTALVHAVAQEGEPVALGIRLSAFSGAGSGIVRMMMQMLVTPSVWWADGQRRTGPPVGPVRPFDLGADRAVPAVRIGLADAPLMHAATGADAAVHLALRPGFLRHGFRFIAAMARLLGPLRPIALAPAHFGLWLLRAVLLKSVPSPVELTAVSGDRHRQLQFADGQVATGHAAAAAVWCWRNLSERPSGVHPVGEVLSVDALLEAMP